MNLRHVVTLIKQRCFDRWHQNSPPTADETRQFELLMEELRTQEQELPANHWTQMARTFEERLTIEAEAPRAPRLSRLTHWQPYLGAIVPLGGLLALGLALHTTEQDVESDAGFDAVALANFWEVGHYDQITAEPLRARDELPHAESSPLRPSIQATTTRPSLTVEPSTQVVATRPNMSHPPPVTRSHPARPHSTSALNAERRDTSRAPLEVQSPLQRPANVTTPVVTESSGPSPIVSPTPDSFAEQLLALKQADKALKLGNTSVAKEKLKRDFSPQLLLHANALRAVSACQSQDKATGQRYLEFQAKRHPHSPYLDRIRRACGSSTLDSK